ncbi:ABC transporter permease [Geodermatophilus sabuli]|uniref:Nucleoside ABC transporter membrane protein n=1 Tax=Geodermatophilus sabuli TaxID=1564158 RepID=A0A285EIJ5_9ACTN|nr:ABC transporter permease [Geodermatophilus sabuli]MBB3086527.1 simple sugar transport system permease protein [Geodermatophilus sabuli]SNX97821.1 nucleoside ABC transporter membrane protein [Geodermatophilus sabuli]
MTEFETLAQLTVIATVPYLLASLGTMLGGLAGVFSVSQEGVMVLGASVGFLVSYGVGSNTVGILCAAGVGAVFGLVLGWATTSLRLDQFVIGLALFFAATGLAGLLFRVVVGQSGAQPLIETLPRLEIPLLSEIPVLGTVLFSNNLLVYFAALVAVGLYFFLYRTRAGLDLRAVGENPKAADSLGIPVARTRIWTATAGGALMAVAGAYLPMVYTGTFTEGIVGGRGWLAIALTFFGGWRPQFIAAGALFFAAMDVIALRAEVGNVAIPSQVLLVVPYVATLLVMIFAFRWARVPAFLGRNYDRESRTA